MEQRDSQALPKVLSLGLGDCFDVGMKVSEESGITPRLLTLAESGVVNNGTINQDSKCQKK